MDFTHSLQKNFVKTEYFRQLCPSQGKNAYSSPSFEASRLGFMANFFFLLHFVLLNFLNVFLTMHVLNTITSIQEITLILQNKGQEKKNSSLFLN